jgi:hypothetical protein
MKCILADPGNTRQRAERHSFRQLPFPLCCSARSGVLAAFHLTINTLNMLAMVLAIGLLVDDAIGRWHCRSWCGGRGTRGRP